MAAKERSMPCFWGLNLQPCRNVFGQVYRKNPDLENVSIIIYFIKMGLPRAAVYRVCQCTETRKTAKRKAESGRQAVQMPQKKRIQLVKTIWDKKKVTSMKLAEKMNADRSFVDRIVREAAVRTYMRIWRPEFRPELEQAKERLWKGQGQKCPFWAPPA